MAICGFLIAAVMAVLPELDTFLDEFAGKRAESKLVTAHFVQETITPDEVLVSFGKLTYVQPRRILFHFEDPEIYWIIDGTRLYHYDVELEQVQIYNVEDDPAASAVFLGLDGDVKRLREAYNLSLFDPEGIECAEIGLSLVPKEDDEDADPLFVESKLYLRADDYLPCSLYIVSDEETRIAMSFEQYVVNGPPDEAETSVFIPPGVKIIEDDVLVEKVGEEGKRIALSKPAETDAP